MPFNKVSKPNQNNPTLLTDVVEYTDCISAEE